MVSEFLEALQLIAHYKYVAILPVAIVEGPIISIVSGFLTSQGHLSLLPAFLVLLVGDFISDSTYYLLGRYGRSKVKYVKPLSPERLREIEDEFVHHPTRAMILAKVSYGLGPAFLIAGGMSKISFGNYWRHLAIPSATKSAALMALGYYFGWALPSIRMYLNYYAAATILIIPTTYYLLSRLKGAREPEVDIDEARSIVEIAKTKVGWLFGKK